MKKILVIGSLLVMIGCTANINYLPTDSKVTYPPTTSTQIFWKEPTEKYHIIGAVTAEGDSAEEVLFEKLKEKAMALGAEGIIIENRETKISSQPYYGAIPLGPPIKFYRIHALLIRFEKPEN